MLKTSPFNCLAFLLLLTLSFSCTPKQGAENKEGLKQYIAGYTSGIISKRAAIRIMFTLPVEEAVINASDNSFIELSPKINGKTKWVDNTTLEFTPEKWFTSGTAYKVSVNLNKILSKVPQGSNFQFGFQTIPQGIDVEIKDMEPYDSRDFTFQRVKGVVRSYDVAEDAKIEQLLKPTQNKQVLNISWEHVGDGKMHYFTVDSVKRSEVKETLLLAFNDALIGGKNTGKKEFVLPAVSDFKLLEVRALNDPDQAIELLFSDPLLETQNLAGLIKLKNQRNIRLEKIGNTVKIYPNQRLDGSIGLVVAQEVKNSLGYPLEKELERSLRFESIKPAVKFIGNGTIVPGSGTLEAPFEAVSLSGVELKIVQIFEDNIMQFLQVNLLNEADEIKRVGRVILKKDISLEKDASLDLKSWNSFSLNLTELIKTEPGALYRVYLGFRQDQSLYNCPDEATDDLNETAETTTNNFPENDEDLWSYSGFDAGYYYYNPAFVWKEREDPCKQSYYLLTERKASRNFLASDLGIIAKAGSDGEVLVAVTNLGTTAPEEGVELNFFNFQQTKIGTATTDNNGLASIRLKSHPFMLMAKKGTQKGYLRLDDGSSLSLSMFDVSGTQAKKGVKGFLYGERGVWRPGDSLYLSFLLEDKLKVLPPKHPVVMEIRDPKGQLAIRKVQTSNLGGFYDFRTATSYDAPTGNWMAKVKVGGTEFSRPLKIETIKPNRLKIKLDFGSELLSNSQKDYTGDLKVNWLHGAPGRNLKAKVQMTLLAGKTHFKKFKDYVFDDPSRFIYASEETVFEGNLNGGGEAEISPKIKTSDLAPGMLKVHFNIQAFEEGGDFSIGYHDINYSPYRNYVGLKIPEGDGWQGALASDKKHQLPIAVVDEQGNLINRDKVKVELYKVRWRWWWEHVETNNLASYVGNTGQYLLKSDYVSLNNGKGFYELDLKDKYWGRLFVRVIDEESGHSAGKLVYMDYDYWNEGGDEDLSGATMLQVSLDKEMYFIGEKATIKFPFAQKGRALVSIENGSRVLDAYWVAPKDGNAGLSFEVTEEMSPNIYVHVTLIQPHQGSGNDLPIRMYGVVSANVNNPNKLLEPELTMAPSIRPNQQFEVKVNEKNGREMNYTLAVVDEGLLDITNFKTPDPMSYFNAKEALGIRTWDLYNHVLGAYSGKMTGLLALGGDEYLKNKGKKQVNRFKPVVKYIGPFKLEKGKTNNHQLQMSNYVGSVKTMVVAAQGGAYGNGETVTPVKQPLMVIGTLPRVLGPKEKVKLPVTLFVMEEGIKKVDVSIKTNDLILVEGGNSRQLNFVSKGDTTLDFNLVVGNALGKGTVEIIAKGNGETASYKVEIEVRPSNPLIVDVIKGSIDKGGQWKTNFKPIGIKGTNRVSVEVSGVPSINLEKRLAYLIQYPHGCVEQTTSGVFPQLYLEEFVNLSPDQKISAKDNIRIGIQRLSRFQLANGGLGFWPGAYEEANEWGTNYAGHFMIEAEKKGYSLPAGFISSWLSYQQDKARNWSYNANRYYGNDLTQAYRLYTLALAGYPVLGAMNRLRELKPISHTAKWRLAAAYFLAGKQDVAKMLVNELTTSVGPYKDANYTYGSPWRDQAMILETLTLMNDKQRAQEVGLELATALGGDDWHSTQTVAYGLLAMAKLYKGEAAGRAIKFTLKQDGEKDQKINSNDPIFVKKIKINTLDNSSLNFENDGDGSLFVRVILEGIPSEDRTTEQYNNLNIKSSYKTLEGEIIDPYNIDQGMSFVAEVVVSHPGVKAGYENLALTQIFPSGWEIRNTRFEGNNTIKLGDEPTYRDYRDDRVLTYFDLPKGKSKTFKVFLNATYKGTYYLPAIYCEAMYDHQINASQKGNWVTIKEPGRKDGD